MEEKNLTLAPKLDIVFQAIFGEVGSEAITKRFLENILNQKFESIDLSKNPILRRETIDSKLGILDVIAKINDKHLCNIEMQFSSSNNIIDRILCYWSIIYSKQLHAGEDYSTLNKAICILISNFKVPSLKHLPYHSSWKIIEENFRQTILTDKLEIHIIELPKIKELTDEDELLDWLFFLDNPKSERVVEKMKTNKELQQANEKFEDFIRDEHLKKIAEWRQKAIYEENSARIEGYDTGLEKGLQEGLEQGHQQGLQEGLEQGHQQGLQEGLEQGTKTAILSIAKNMLLAGFDIISILKATHLSETEILNIKKELGD